MTENLEDLPITEADKLARARIEQHRDEMGQWRRARAERVAQERKTRSVTEIAADIGVHPQVVYDLLREAKNATDGWWDRLNEEDRRLFLTHRDAYPLPAEVVQRLTATRQVVVGGKWEGQEGFDFMWPSHLQRFLEEKASKAS